MYIWIYQRVPQRGRAWLCDQSCSWLRDDALFSSPSTENFAWIKLRALLRYSANRIESFKIFDFPRVSLSPSSKLHIYIYIYIFSVCIYLCIQLCTVYMRTYNYINGLLHQYPQIYFELAKWCYDLKRFNTQVPEFEILGL